MAQQSMIDRRSTHFRHTAVQPPENLRQKRLTLSAVNTLDRPLYPLGEQRELASRRKGIAQRLGGVLLRSAAKLVFPDRGTTHRRALEALRYAYSGNSC